MKKGIDRSSKTPIFRQIYDILLSEMIGGIYAVNGNMPSEKELCLRFDVERNTVRKALQILVEEKRITRIPGIGSRVLPAGEAKKNPFPSGRPAAETGRIIILVTQIDYLHSPDGESFHYRLIHGFEKRLSRLGYNLLFKPAGKDGTVAETVRSTAPQGIIFDSFNQDTHYREAVRSGLPCISVNHYTPFFTSIVSNNFDGAYRIAELLTGAGHDKIAFITGKSSHQSNMERLSGVQTLYAARGVSLRPEYLIPSDWTFASGALAAERILSMKAAERPTAVFAFNDDLAYGCYSVLERRGLKIPEDISVVGFDKSDRYKDMFPPITTVDVNLDAIVDYASWYLDNRFSGQAPETCAKIQIDTTICDNGTIKALA
ncbi:MAG: GntR family transcriptional regulator [Treponema sp.]|jgi:DNA-binding LacI/PurR family transcriptional regulator|nr:GntR family transcriptional regulator [Treponema sp.]